LIAIPCRLLIFAARIGKRASRRIESASEDNTKIQIMVTQTGQVYAKVRIQLVAGMDCIFIAMQEQKLIINAPAAVITRRED
jgi:hypothetical protein